MKKMATLKEKLNQLEEAKHLLGDRYEALKQQIIDSFVKGPAPTGNDFVTRSRGL
jgi:hypothetical protein